MELSMAFKRLSLFAVAATFLILGGRPILAQTSGDGNINGTIIDASGAAVPNTTVVVLNTLLRFVCTSLFRNPLDDLFPPSFSYGYACCGGADRAEPTQVLSKERDSGRYGRVVCRVGWYYLASKTPSIRFFQHPHK